MWYADIIGTGDFFQSRVCVMSAYLIMVNYSTSCMCYVDIAGKSKAPTAEQ